MFVLVDGTVGKEREEWVLRGDDVRIGTSSFLPTYLFKNPPVSACPIAHFKSVWFTLFYLNFLTRFWKRGLSSSKEHRTNLLALTGCIYISQAVHTSDSHWMNEVKIVCTPGVKWRTVQSAEAPWGLGLGLGSDLGEKCSAHLGRRTAWRASTNEIYNWRKIQEFVSAVK